MEPLGDYPVIPRDSQVTIASAWQIPARPLPLGLPEREGTSVQGSGPPHPAPWLAFGPPGCGSAVTYSTGPPA